jgi:hypothetical protein
MNIADLMYLYPRDLLFMLLKVPLRQDIMKRVETFALQHKTGLQQPLVTNSIKSCFCHSTYTVTCAIFRNNLMFLNQLYC